MDDYSMPLADLSQTDKHAEAFGDAQTRILSALDLGAMFSGKRVVFITTKNTDYIRNTQEIGILRRYAGSCKVISSGRKSYPARLLDIYLQILLTPFRKYDCVFVGFSPQLICPVWAWKFCGGLVIDFFISVYDTFVNDRKKFKPKGLPAFIAKHLDAATLKAADFTISDTREHAKYFASEFHMPSGKIGVLYLDANRDIYYPQCVPKRGGLEDKYVVLYFGSILPLQGVDVILMAARLLEKESHISFQVIGPVDKENRTGLENVEFIPWLSERELARHIASCDLCLAGHFNGEIGKAKRTIAGKAYIYEAMGKPFILGDNPANRELFREDGMHFFVEMSSAEKLADRILQLKHSWEAARGHSDEQD